MASIQWDPTLETGDPLVDEQHRNIHELFADLENAGDDPSEIMDILDRLMEHVDCHFATEEDLMTRAAYPAEAIERHVADHSQLTEGARDMVLRFRTGEIASTAPIVAFLREWLADHVHQCDRELVEHVRAHGQAARLPEPWATKPPRASGSAA